MGDLGKGPGGPAPLFLAKTEARRAEKCFWRPPPPYLIVWMTAPPPPALSEGPGSASEYRAKIVQGIPINCLNATGQAASCRQYYCQTVKITMIVDGANVSDK